MRKEKGTTSYHAGLLAEGSVERYYQQAGSSILARRWRGDGGEIDLVARDGAEVVFIEVKRSTTHARAAEALGRRQMVRIFQAAAEYLERETLGQLTPARFDVALVDGAGRVEILQNAFAA